MKLALIILCALVVWFLDRIERRTRGRGSWTYDRFLLRAQGAFVCAALYTLLS